MNFISVLLIGVGLSMDAFAAAICKGLAIKRNFLEKSLVIALFFGVFQGFMLAIATSIDALAVGVSFAFLKIRISLAVLVIGLTTFIISFAGVQIGKFFGIALKDKAQVAGGVILILLGTKILVEHLGLLTL